MNAITPECMQERKNKQKTIFFRPKRTGYYKVQNQDRRLAFNKRWIHEDWVYFIGVGQSVLNDL
jgi:hypothetical protein